ncbi:MAG: deoxyribonuclease IV [Victivallales bacterium]|nr:deoxyribonuclease IV [Victivallales bacterium]
MKYFGAHCSIAGGLQNAAIQANSIGATGFAMFTKSQRQWAAKPIQDEEAQLFRKTCKDLGYTPDMILPHDGYLINLGQPDAEKRTQSLHAFIDELQRCRILGLRMLNFHPGSHLKLVPESEDIRIIGESVRIALNEVPDVIAVFENTAGQGSNLGFTFGQLADMMAVVGMPDRVGVCFDTCHGFAAGYGLVTDEEFDRTFEEFDKTIGLKYLKGMHLNDAKGVRGQKLDRHAPLGEGNIGYAPFARIASDSRFDNIPLILETPDEAKWPQEISWLKEHAS